MNKTLLLGTMLVGIASFFTACEDDRDANPTLIQPTSLALNTPAYVNQTISLENTASLNLTWSQPQFTVENAPINATYEIQVSPTNTFTTSVAEANADESGETLADYDVMPNTFQKCSGTMVGADINTSLLKICKWTAEDTPNETSIFVRVLGYVLEGTKKLNSVASNVVELKVTPYYRNLQNADPIIWYLLGDNIGDGSWSTSNDKIGVGTMPMFLIPGFKYDSSTGEGDIQYINYFSTDGFKINPSNLSDWDNGFMSGGSANTAEFRNGAGDKGNIWVDPAGYYKIVINTKDNTCTITPYEATPNVYDMICITGSFCDWADVNMTPANKSGENHVWAYELTVPEGAVEQIKFKIPGSWDTNWGFGTEDGEVNVCGKGTSGGKNIGVAEGTWIVMFNDMTGEFSIIKKQE